MKKLIIVCFFLLLIPTKLFAMELVLLKTEKTLRLYLLNTAHEGVQVNKRFALGPSHGVNEISFSIIDDKGKEFPFSPKIKIAAASQEDLILLWPGMLIGQEYYLGSLVEDYELVPGKYTVKASYRSSVGHGFGILESNFLTIVID